MPNTPKDFTMECIVRNAIEIHDMVTSLAEGLKSLDENATVGDALKLFDAFYADIEQMKKHQTETRVSPSYLIACIDIYKIPSTKYVQMNGNKHKLVKDKGKATLFYEKQDAEIVQKLLDNDFEGNFVIIDNDWKIQRNYIIRR